MKVRKYKAMARNARILPIVTMIITLFSCSGNMEREEILDALNKSSKKNLILEKEYLVPNKFIEGNNRLNIITLGSTDCTDCYVKMERWNKFIEDNEFMQHFDVFFLLYHEKPEYFRQNVENQPYNFKIVYDPETKFVVDNKLEDFARATLLVTDEGKVLVSGSPLEDERVFKIY